jgi:hypothetical protein
MFFQICMFWQQFVSRVATDQKEGLTFKTRRGFFHDERTPLLHEIDLTPTVLMGCRPLAGGDSSTTKDPRSYGPKREV